MGGQVRSAPDCPACEAGVMDTKESRPSRNNDVVRRRRKVCRNCGYKCTTHEVIVQDDLGFANGHVRRVRDFLGDVESLVRERFGDEAGRLWSE